MIVRQGTERSRRGTAEDHHIRLSRPYLFNGPWEIVLEHSHFRFTSHIGEKDSRSAHDGHRAEMPVKVRFHHGVGRGYDQADTQGLSWHFSVPPMKFGSLTALRMGYVSTSHQG